MKAAGGKIKEPPAITKADDFVFGCLHDMAGERNYNGDIPYRAVMYWGSYNGIPKRVISIIWETIKISEGEINEWQAKQSK